jgi:predicted lysophospholipase L1 biosynthesis ABC-type transport system permease subunit
MREKVYAFFAALFLILLLLLFEGDKLVKVLFVGGIMLFVLVVYELAYRKL